jgi:hypothetical protein
MEQISANLKIIGTNGLLKDLLDKEFKAYSIAANEIGCILCKLNDGSEIYFNKNPKVEFVVEGFTIEGLAQIGYLIGNIKVLLTNINK